MNENSPDISEDDIDEMLALAFIEDPRTRKFAIELILKRSVTPTEMAFGDIHSIIEIGTENGDPIGTIGLLKMKRRMEEQIRNN
ncbi:hypothetical protein A2Z22_01215 [Candidatus Woesebacteria bacterium RBG_16_34_12]|uniref:Uncharacterized protein n=1 Tax=Candidatus Woesebacteria bacterium RBG_16_34_12 TaxID=1802480 RepID=A0A1F7XAK4_9BACT|nr:MAG: hypothetical protein A2Z22_01215 [Candidatus Woesebacteria bacterium RBG_16_34_12]